MKFYECCDLTEKVYLMYIQKMKKCADLVCQGQGREKLSCTQFDFGWHLSTRKSRWLNDLTKVLNFDHGGWILKHTIMHNQAMKYAKGSKSVGFPKVHS